MSWTSMHFAVGMAGAGMLAGGVSLVVPRVARLIPVAMTAGGLWALVPDLPRIWREDLPWLPLAKMFGSQSLEAMLHHWGDLFFLHRWMDANLGDLALHGIVGMILLYNLSIVWLLHLERKARLSPGNRAWHAHAPYLAQRQGQAPPTAETPPLSLPLPRRRPSSTGVLPLMRT